MVFGFLHIFSLQIKVITKLPNSEQSYKGKVHSQQGVDLIKNQVVNLLFRGIMVLSLTRTPPRESPAAENRYRACSTPVQQDVLTIDYHLPLEMTPETGRLDGNTSVTGTAVVYRIPLCLEGRIKILLKWVSLC